MAISPCILEELTVGNDLWGGTLSEGILNSKFLQNAGGNRHESELSLEIGNKKYDKQVLF